MRPIVLQQGIPTSLQGFIDQYGDALISAATTVVLFVVAFVIVYAVARFVLVRLTRRALDARGFDRTVVGLGGRVAGAVALFAAVALAATIAGFGTVLAAFATLLGALSLALGFAAQGLISNFVAGVFILRDKPFEAGDWIEWPSGDRTKSGVVQDIRLRVTKLETFNNELITVPNTELAENAVTNPVANGQLRIPFLFGIGYEDDIDEAKEILIQEASTTDGVLGDPEPSVILTELADSYVGLTARVWIDDADRGTYVNVLSDYVQAVKERFDAEGIDMPYPYTELTGGIDIDNIAEAEQARADD
jgi:small conductance mechanosensitive channel